MQDIGEKTKRAVPWLTASQIIRPVWEFCVGVILARILLPKEFGIFAIATIFCTIGTVVSNFGIPSKIIQARSLEKKFLSTAQTITSIAGTILFCILLSVSSIISSFFKEPLGGAVTICLALSLPISSFGGIPMSLLTRQMDFKKICIIEISCSLVYGLSALGMVFNSFGVWTLVFAPLISIALSALLCSAAARYVPHFGWDKKAASEILRFGGALSASSILNQMARNIDYLIIGRFLGGGPLGLYKRAYDLSVMPKEKIADVIARVFFPAICEVRENSAKAKVAFLKANKVISLSCLPPLLMLVLAADDIIRVLYGPNWIGAIGSVRILGVGALFYCMIVPVGPVMMAYSRMKYYLYSQVVYSFLLLLLCILFIRYGISGVASGVTVVLLVTWLVNFVLCKYILSFSVLEYFKSLSQSFKLAAIMLVGVVPLCIFYKEERRLESLLIKALVGGGAILIYLFTSNDEDIKQLRLTTLNKFGLYQQRISPQ